MGGRVEHGWKTIRVRLSEDERSTLTKVIRAEKGVPPKKRMRAQILLKSRSGRARTGLDRRADRESVGCARELGSRSPAGVGDRRVRAGAGSKEQRRRSRERIFDEAKERTLIATAQGDPPRGRSRWTLHLLADRMVELEIVEKVSHETVRKVLKKTRWIPNDRWRG